MAVPDDPSLALVNLTSGMTFSSKPFTNWIVAAFSSVVWIRVDGEKVEEGAKALMRGAVTATMIVWSFMVLIF